MVAVEFGAPSTAGGQYDFKAITGETEDVPKGMASRVAKKCVEKGMLLLTTSVYEVVRFIPPLNISKEEMKEGCQIFAEAVKEVVKEG